MTRGFHVATSAHQAEKRGTYLSTIFTNENLSLSTNLKFQHVKYTLSFFSTLLLLEKL